MRFVTNTSSNISWLLFKLTITAVKFQNYDLPYLTANPPHGPAEEFCTDFKCSKGYSLVDDAKTTLCKDSECTKDVCCEPEGETWSSADICIKQEDTYFVHMV